MENTIWEDDQLKLTRREQSRRVVVKWVVTLIIGIITGLFAFLLALGIQWSIYGKMALVYYLVSTCDNCLWLPYLAYLGITVASVAMAAGFVAFVEPAAGGSGIPEIKCYLNGVKGKLGRGSVMSAIICTHLLCQKSQFRTWFAFRLS